MGGLFPFILVGPEGVQFMKIFIFQFERFGPSNTPYHIILWAMENLWFCLLIVIMVGVYLKGNYHKIKHLVNFNLLMMLECYGNSPTRFAKPSYG